MNKGGARVHVSERKFLKEPQKWVDARAAGKLTGAKFGSYASLFGEARWRRPALLGMCLCISGVVGLWGIGFFSPELVGDVLERSLKQEGVTPDKIAKAKTVWTGVNMIVQNIGAFCGMIAFTKSLAREVTGFGGRVNCVCPGPTDTPLFHAATVHQQGIVQTMLNRIPVKRMTQPEEPTDATVFLASDSAGYITGQTLGVNGGVNML